MDTDSMFRAVMAVISEGADGLGEYLVVPGALVPPSVAEWVIPMQQMVNAALSAFGSPQELQGALTAAGYETEQIAFLAWSWTWYHNLREDPGPYPVPAGGWQVPVGKAKPPEPPAGGPAFGL
jgi:hypothetical protein